MDLQALANNPNVIIQNGDGNEYISVYNDGDTPQGWYIGSNQSDATCLPCVMNNTITNIDWGYWDEDVTIIVSMNDVDVLKDTNEQMYARVVDFWGTRPTRRP